MYRLGELSDDRRRRIGGLLLVAGTVLMIIAVAIVHEFGRPAEGISGSPIAGLLEALPLGALKYFKALGYLIAFAASQMMLGGAALLWVLNQPMTWARATFASFIAWMELVMIFGIVPSEWLNFSQTDLEWSFQDVLFQIPPFLVLGNEVEIPTGAIKDAISGGYNVTMLALAGVFAYQLQKIKDGRPASAKEAETQVSPYGRPLVERSKPGGDA